MKELSQKQQVFLHRHSLDLGVLEAASRFEGRHEGQNFLRSDDRAFACKGAIVVREEARIQDCVEDEQVVHQQIGVIVERHNAPL